MRRLMTLVLLAVSLSACTHYRPARAPANATLLWISVDGLRGDHVTPETAPYLASLMSHAHYTHEMVPVFPSLTFPSHVSEVTGVPPGVHGIVSNTFLDTTTNVRHNMGSGGAGAIESEPIWHTATRQGVRTAVFDWPHSQNQPALPAGTPKPAYAAARYDPDLTDAARIQQLVDAYRTDFASNPGSPPLRLLMGYVHAVDTAGHRHGPGAVGTLAAVRATDTVLKNAVEQVVTIHREHRPANEPLYVLITTDHGMSPVHTAVNARALIAGTKAPLPEAVQVQASACLAHVYLHAVPAEQQKATRATILANLSKAAHLQYWTKDSLPKGWRYTHPTRTGDIVVCLDEGYTFTSQTSSTRPSNKGQHGYDPARTPNMRGLTLLTRLSPAPTAPSRNLGPLDSLRLHPTATRILDIAPAPAATAPPLATLPR